MISTCFLFYPLIKNGNSSYVMNCDVAMQVYVIWFYSTGGNLEQKSQMCVVCNNTYLS